MNIKWYAHHEILLWEELAKKKLAKYCQNHKIDNISLLYRMNEWKKEMVKNEWNGQKCKRKLF